MSKLIFFIDDDKMILNLLEYTFQSRQDYDVVCYNTGEECLENLHREPSLIVLDKKTGQLAATDDDLIRQIAQASMELDDAE